MTWNHSSTNILVPEWRTVSHNCDAGNTESLIPGQSSGSRACGAQQEERLTEMYLKSMSALSSVASSWSSLFLSLPERSSLSMNLATSSAGLYDATLLAAPLFVQACKDPEQPMLI